LDAYLLHETSHAALQPWRAAAEVAKLYFGATLNPLAHTRFGRTAAATCELFERTTRRYDKPGFGLTSTPVAGERVSVTERVVWERPFCRVLSFDRALPSDVKPQPKLLVVAPMSGHYATLLRGTVDAFLPTHQVFITD
jgi:poly(3-hydroxybutyrate) depolymerase